MANQSLKRWLKSPLVARKIFSLFEPEKQSSSISSPLCFVAHHLAALNLFFSRVGGSHEGHPFHPQPPLSQTKLPLFLPVSAQISLPLSLENAHTWSLHLVYDADERLVMRVCVCVRARECVWERERETETGRQRDRGIEGQRDRETERERAWGTRTSPITKFASNFCQNTKQGLLGFSDRRQPGHIWGRGLSRTSMWQEKSFEESNTSNEATEPA